MISHKLFMNHPLDNWFFKCVLWAPLAHENPVETRREKTVILSVRTTCEGGQGSKIQWNERKIKERQPCPAGSKIRNGIKRRCNFRSSCSRALLADCHQWSSRSPTTAFNGSGKIHHTCFFTVCVYVCADVCVGPCVCVCVSCDCFLQPSSVWRAESIWPSAAVGPN